MLEERLTTSQISNLNSIYNSNINTDYFCTNNFEYSETIYNYFSESLKNTTSFNIKTQDYSNDFILLPLNSSYTKTKHLRALSYSSISAFEEKDILSTIITLNQNERRGSNLSGNSNTTTATSGIRNSSTSSSVGVILQNIECEDTIKLILIGDKNVGKTRLVNNFLYNNISNKSNSEDKSSLNDHSYETTIG